jgi:hypothetical protein
MSLLSLSLSLSLPPPPVRLHLSLTHTGALCGRRAVYAVAAFTGNFSSVQFIFSEWGSVFLLTRDKQVLAAPS